jgi:hypothetical protein
MYLSVPAASCKYTSTVSRGMTVIDPRIRGWRIFSGPFCFAHGCAEGRSVRPRESAVSGIFEEEFPRFTAGLMVFDASPQ